MADFGPDCICWCQVRPIVCTLSGCECVIHDHRPLTPSADLSACRDEDPAHAATLAAAYPDPAEYPHPEDDHD